jgi:hypothetical protein
MQDQLSEHYKNVGIQTGTGLFERMKVRFRISSPNLSLNQTQQDMTVKFMTDNGEQLYSAISEDTCDKFTKLASDIDVMTKENLTTIVKLLLSLLGRACKYSFPN